MGNELPKLRITGLFRITLPRQRKRWPESGLVISLQEFPKLYRNRLELTIIGVTDPWPVWLSPAGSGAEQDYTSAWAMHCPPYESMQVGVPGQAGLD